MKFIPIILFVLAWIFAFIDQHYNPGPYINYLMTYILLLSVGVRYLWAFIGYCFCPDKVADCLGKKPSGFQYDVGIIALALGVVGVLCFAYTDLWLATSLIVIIYGIGHAYGHLLEMIRNKGNGGCGIIPFNSLVVSITLIVGLWMMHMV